MCVVCAVVYLLNSEDVDRCLTVGTVKIVWTKN